MTNTDRPSDPMLEASRRRLDATPTFALLPTPRRIPPRRSRRNPSHAIAPRPANGVTLRPSALDD